MEQKTTKTANFIFCVLSLTVITAASFFSMNAFTRPVFGNITQWQLSFYVLAICLCLCAILKKPLIQLCVCTAAAVAMQFCSPLYFGLFFPVALQAAVFDGANDHRGSGTAAFLLSLALFPATVVFRVKAGQYLSLNSMSFSGSEPAGEACVCFAGLLLQAALWGWLLIRSMQKEPEKKPFAGKGKKKGNHKKTQNASAGKKKTDRNRLPAVYLVCILNTIATGIQCVLLFTGEFTKTMFFSSALFLCFLLFRQAIPFDIIKKCKAFFFPTKPESPENQEETT